MITSWWQSPVEKIATRSWTFWSPHKYLTDDGQFYVIRPLIEMAERDIINYANKRAFPILPCNLCGSQEGLKRERMKQLLDMLEEEKPDVRSVMLHALKNVNASHL